MSATDVSDANILGDRGLRYKRNTLAACLIATVLYWTDAPLGQVNLFGVGLSNVEDQKEAAAWTIFLAILSYQWVMLTYYGWRDWSTWQQRIRETFLLSPLNIAFWLKGARVWIDTGPGKNFIYKVKKVPEGIDWDARPPGSTGACHGATIIRNHIGNIRWRLFAFLTIEFGLPFLWGLYCLFIAVSKSKDLLL